MLCPQRFYNTFTINPKWQVVICGTNKSNFNGRFKLVPITTNHL